MIISDITLLVDRIKLLSKGKRINEECTKNFLVLPFLQYLGYDTSDPEVIEYEYVCDIHEKGNRKVDCVLFDEKRFPHIIVEVKPLGNDIYGSLGQVRSYFFSSGANFAILTDGNKYILFTKEQLRNDLMNVSPSYSFSLSELKDSDNEIINLISRENIPPIECLIPVECERDDVVDSADLDSFDYYCMRISAKDLVGRPTNVAYQNYLDFCDLNNEEPIILINWSKMIKNKFNLKIIDKKIKGKKYRIFLSGDEYEKYKKTKFRLSK